MAEVADVAGISKRSTIVLLSGGIDSTLCGLIAARDDHEFVCLSVDYGQARGEQDAAIAIASYYEWCLVRASVTPFPHSLDPAGTNLIPGRNAIFLSLATAMLSASRGCVYIGANADDARDYPDCRLE